MPGDSVPMLDPRRTRDAAASRFRATARVGDPDVVVAQDDKGGAADGNRVACPLLAIERQRLFIACRVGTQDPDNSWRGGRYEIRTESRRTWDRCPLPSVPSPMQVVSRQVAVVAVMVNPRPGVVAAWRRESTKLVRVGRYAVSDMPATRRGLAAHCSGGGT